MNEIEPVVHSGYAIWLALAVAAFALWQGVQIGRVAWIRFKYRDQTFSNPEWQRLVDALPKRPIWRQALVAFFFCMTGVLMLLAAADLRWNFL